MATGPTADQAFDHRALGEALAAATAALAELHSPDPSSVEGARKAVAAVDHLDLVLVYHLRSEEEDEGAFAEILAAAPHVAAKLDVLRLEHGPIAARMKKIVEDAGWAGVSRAAWRRVAGALHALAYELRRHECAEQELAADALLIDEGGGD